MGDDPALKYSEPFSVEDISDIRFRRQWALLPEKDSYPKHFRNIRLSHDYILCYHPDTRINRVEREGYQAILIGLAFHPSSPETDLTRLLNQIECNSHDHVALFLQSLAGTYVLVCDNPSGIYLYTDPGAMMGVYYSDGRASSSPSLLPKLMRDEELDRVYPFGGTDDWYPGALCPFPGVKALLANHRLDLLHSTIERFWYPQCSERLNHKEGVERVCSLLKGAMMGIAKSGAVLASITGGRDSRVNLSASRSILEQVEFFTIRTKDVKPCDIQYPEMMAQQFGLNHRFIDAPPPEPWLQELYDEISAGMAIGARREIVGACRLLASSKYIHVNGNLGAITKSFFWHNKHPKTVRIKSLAKEFIHKPPPIMNALEEWLQTVPNLPATVIYNLMYLEQRGGRWMGVGENSSNLFYESVTPFNSREVFETICQMPEEVQYGGSLLVDFVRFMWPDLLKIPYCPVTRNWGTYIPKRFKDLIRKLIRR